MKKLNTLIILFICALFAQLNAQTGRYQSEVFTSVKVTKGITYAVNATVLLLAQFGEAVPQSLTMDVYEPVGDTRTDRPLALIMHTGNFLPNPQNGGTTGTMGDSSIVYLANRLAKMGYVAASVDYRLGWNPLAPTQDERATTIIQAVWRGIQDLRSCIRFFRKNVATGGNTYGIDPNKILAWGDGTGGYIVMATSNLTAYQQVLLPKFILQVGGQPFPMVQEPVNGNMDGTSVGIQPAGYPGFPAGDTLCYPNTLGYASDFKLSVNMGGALGDSSWITPGRPAMISFHVPSDPFAPYTEGIVIVPGLNVPVVHVQGSYVVQAKVKKLGLNAAWAGKGYKGDFSGVANSRNDGNDGLFPLLGSIPFDSSPWSWWSPTHVNHAASSQTNPNMSAAKGKSYIDTMIAYVAPRACVTLGLGCTLVNTNELKASEVGLSMSPNPATSQVKIETSFSHPMESVYVYDMTGRLVKANTSIHASTFTMERNTLVSGTYVVKINMKQGSVSQKLMFY